MRARVRIPQVASYWAMYHVARHYDRLTTRMPWQWYLERAARTSLRFSCGTGVMDGTVFRQVLELSSFPCFSPRPAWCYPKILVLMR